MRHHRGIPAVASLATALALLAACSGTTTATPPTATNVVKPVEVRTDDGKVRFRVTPGVEQVTVTEAEPKSKLTLIDGSGKRRVTLIADDLGQATFSYIPTNYMEIETGKGNVPPTIDGATLKKGSGFTIVNESASPAETSAPFAVLGRDDHPSESLYQDQKLGGVPMSVLGGTADGHSVEEGVNYIKTRDGTTLSAMVRFPDKTLYGDGPYPTVVEISGYDPSNPEAPQPGTMIAGAFGFATVGVNLRGTGCSGGTFDVFNPAQQADGYDVIETVARQPWVANHKVGMVGLSYSGITQLYVASTQPPSLAAIAPLSVIEDPWKMSWPGGIYNAGFTKQWLEERDRQAKSGGQGWAQKRAANGDNLCADNQKIRTQNIDFQGFSESLTTRPADSDNRDLSKLVPSITVPVYLTGGWQDEQTGPRFATMLDKFTGTTNKHFVLFNGHHPDGYAPYNLTRWYEFLSIYVARKVPRLPAIVRAGAGAEFAKAFSVEGITFQEDRFAGLAEDDLAGAEAIWDADPVVKVLFGWGTGFAPVPGAPEPGFTAGFTQWPPANVQPLQLWLAAGGSLAAAAPAEEGVDGFEYDPDAGPIGYASAGAYDFQAPTIKADWTNAPPGKGLSYVTEPLAQDAIIAGPGYVDLWMKSTTDDADIEVVLSEITPDGTEFRIQNGLLRASHRKVDEARSNQFLIQESFSASDRQPLVPGELTQVKVPIFPVAHPLRAGSRLRLQINTPGRDLPLWFFETEGAAGDRYGVSHGGAMASSLMLPVLPAGEVAITTPLPPCPSLRGQVCRPYTPSENAPG